MSSTGADDGLAYRPRPPLNIYALRVKDVSIV